MCTRDRLPDDSVYGPPTEAVRTDGDPDRYATLPRDDAFRLLGDGRRRAILRFLLDDRRETPTSLSTLATFVAAVEHRNGDADQPVGELQPRVRIALHHSHLPLLDDHDLVRYDPEERTVERRPLLATLAPFLPDPLDGDGELTADARTVDGDGFADLDDVGGSRRDVDDS